MRYTDASLARLGPVHELVVQNDEHFLRTVAKGQIIFAPHQAAEEFFRLGLRRGSTLIFDPNLRLKLWDIGEARRVLIPLMQQSNYVLPGAEELKLLMDSWGKLRSIFI